MKNKYIIAIVVATLVLLLTFVLLHIHIFISLVVSLAAYYATTLVIPNRKITITHDTNLDDIVAFGNYKIKEIKEMIPKLENESVQKNVAQICDINTKIIQEIQKRPKKSNQIKNFIHYYLPLTLRILTQYDAVENQKLSSEESSEYLESVSKLAIKIKDASSNQLNTLFTQDMLDSKADIQVFETMLKSDGLLDNDLNIKKKEVK